MNKQQADYCDALSSGNVEMWKPGLMALITIDEYSQHIRDKGKKISNYHIVEYEETAADVADKAIIRMINQ